MKYIVIRCRKDHHVLKGVPSWAIVPDEPVDRSRTEINRLLTEWKCAAIGWTDHLNEGRVDCNFTWERDGAHYRVRFTVTIPKVLERSNRHRLGAWNQQTRRYESKPTEDEAGQLWRSAHRLLLLKLKADLNAAASGLAKAEEIFLPWMVDQNGKTVAEVLLPTLKANYAALPPHKGT